MAKGLSQAQLGNRLGVTFQQVQKYEVGSNRIGTGRLVKLAAVLGIPIAACSPAPRAPIPRARCSRSLQTNAPSDSPKRLQRSRTRSPE
jgi:transcriptional regulator with XRE-family HTH domain